MGGSGLQRAEAAGAWRNALKPNQRGAGVWMLCVQGKRSALRGTLVNKRTVDALRSHWGDCGLDLDALPSTQISSDDGSPAGIALLGPLAIPLHTVAIARHETASANGYTADGLYRLVATTFGRLKPGLLGAGISRRYHAQLEATTPHAFRHTCG